MNKTPSIDRWAPPIDYPSRNKQTQTYQTKLTKPNQTYQTKPTKPNLPNLTYQTWVNPTYLHADRPHHAPLFFGHFSSWLESLDNKTPQPEVKFENYPKKMGKAGLRSLVPKMRTAPITPPFFGGIFSCDEQLKK